ncbi:MAG: hypothetical protein R3F60_08150 [bacterium]
MREELAGDVDLPIETERLFRAELFITLALDALGTGHRSCPLDAGGAVMATRTLTASVVTEGWASLQAGCFRRVARQAHADWTPADLNDEFALWRAAP